MKNFTLLCTGLLWQKFIDTTVVKLLIGELTIRGMEVFRLVSAGATP
jgi:hypothetical protein